ncbi:MAG: tRNA uridine-5-carboxymethylaminomethyl(34) synthesis GTPase MnmE [Candidatus Korobacteraceae bacterium]
MNLDDTIVAIATPPGRGGIGVVRLSGAEARNITRPMLRLAHEGDPEAGRAHFGELIEPATGERLDEVVVTFFPKPHSYTTEDVIEISCHGSPVLLRHAVQLALERGARLAEPGEFTMRAFLNGRIDLTQAEAVRDLIESQTLYQAQVAARQLAGAVSRRLQPTKQKLMELIATLEAGVDFAEDDVAVISDEQILSHIAAVRRPLRELLASFSFGKVVNEGLTLAIVGRPNVGKSSVFNRLVQRDRAIVTATPGTTRDLVTETVSIGGIPVRLVDTAGIRTALDEAESIGVRKSVEAIADADIVLVVLDVSEFPHSGFVPDRELLEQTRDRPSIVVCNKSDLLAGKKDVITNTLPGKDHAAAVFTSALTGEGITQLQSMIFERVHGDSAEQETGFLTNVRQQVLVADAIAALDRASAAVPLKTPHEMVLLDLYSALRPLDDITGATTAEDILSLIFSSFCIGK